MALALRPQHAAVGVVGALVLRHADLLYQAFLHQAGWGASAGLAAAVGAAQAAAEAATLAAAAATSAGEARDEQCYAPPEWLCTVEAPACPEQPACECLCGGAEVGVEHEFQPTAEHAWQVLCATVGHAIAVSLGRLCARRRQHDEPAAAPPAAGDRRGAAAERAAVEWTGGTPSFQRSRRRGGGVLE